MMCQGGEGGAQDCKDNGASRVHRRHLSGELYGGHRRGAGDRARSLYRHPDVVRLSRQVPRATYREKGRLCAVQTYVSSRCSFMVSVLNRTTFPFVDVVVDD